MEVTATATSRIQWVEISRVIAMLSVVLQHVPKECPANGPVLSSSLALFFILSGYFSAGKTREMGVSLFLKCRIFPLLKAYAAWSILFAICLYMAGLMGFAPLVSIDEFSLASVFGLGEAPLLTPMWFVRDLAVFLLAVFLLIRLGKTGYGLVCLAGFAALYVKNIGSPHAWPSTYMFGNFCLGFILGGIPELPGKWMRLPRAIHYGLAGSFCILLVFVSSPLGGLIYFPLTPLGVAAVSSGGVLLQGTRWGGAMARVAAATFFVFGFHIFVISFFQVLEMCSFDWPSALWWCLAPVIYILCVAVYGMLKRFCPRIGGLLNAR